MTEKKQFQRADWSKRPLSSAQLNYATNDTYFLHHVAQNQLVKSKMAPDTLSKWLEEFNVEKVQKARFRSQASVWVKEEGYRKSYKKEMDYFDT